MQPNLNTFNLGFQALTLRRALAFVGVSLLAITTFGQTLYWDTNGTTAGSSGANGTWGTSTFWSTNSAGTSATTGFTSGRDAVFSAGTNATGSYTVTISGVQNVSSITVQEGTPTFTGGQINFNDATPDLTTSAGTTLNWGMTGIASSTNSLNIGGAGVTNLTLSGTFAGTINLSGGTLRLTNSTLGVDTLNITGNSVIDFAGTASSLTLTNFSISAGVTLTIQNWAAATDFFYTTNWTGASYNTMGSAPMNRVTFTGFAANQTGWDSYDNQIRPNVPEPATYGAILLGSVTVLLAARRRRTIPGN
jgi:hypothetical protein